MDVRERDGKFIISGDGMVTDLIVDPETPQQYPNDGYPAVIADQRHGYQVEAVEEVEVHWIDTLLRSGVEMWTDGRQAIPYVNRARFLVDCPGCNASNWAWDQNPYACCMDCGLLVKVQWQAPLIRSQAIRLLAVRPIVNCNWNAHKGETVEELERENRWLLDEPSVEKNGLVVPKGLNVPEALERYVDPKVA